MELIPLFGVFGIILLAVIAFELLVIGDYLGNILTELRGSR